MGVETTPPVSPRPTITKEIGESLLSIYQSLNEDLIAAGAVCNACGRCCRLQEFGHQLWISNLELAWLIFEAGPPLYPDNAKNGTCPYLQNNLCGARNGRALGCRVFHCNLTEDTLQPIHEKHLRRIQHLARQHNIDFTYGEFLSSLEETRPKIASSTQAVSSNGENPCTNR